MNIIINGEPVAIGTAIGGGYLSGECMIDGEKYAIVTAPKAVGETELPWLDSEDDVPGANHFSDGLTNTIAMAAAGSPLAAWALALDIGGHRDWHIGAQDQVEMQYRYLKPTTKENYLYGRSGINVSAIPPTYPYTATEPAQTSLEAFQAGGTEALDPVWYWTSTQHAASSVNAWLQHFSDGLQYDHDESYARRARAFRRFKI